ncbi:MAG: OsmC family protein [Bryobacterales bacterium]|nr:OsmC family protein [Bryobacterales bacterium]
MSEVVSEFSISVRQVKDYEFVVRFDKPESLEMTTDEGPPLGKDAGPSPSRMLAAAVVNCLSASLLFAFRKAGVATGGIESTVTVQIARNEKRRLRIGKMTVVLDPKLSGEDLEKARAARAVFEDYCTVTQSVASGVAVEVKVKGIDV